jgi:hypothetical protein
MSIIDTSSIQILSNDDTKRRGAGAGRRGIVVKVFWLLRRAEGLDRDAFVQWWLERHAPEVAARQGRFLKFYAVNLRRGDDGELPAGTGAESAWDGIAEEVFHSLEDARAALTLPSAPGSRADVLRHVSRFERLIVDEHVFIGPPGGIAG